MTSFEEGPKVKQQTTSLGVSVVVTVFLSLVLFAYFLPTDTTVISAGNSKTSELNLDKRGLNIIPTDELCAIQLREPLGRINVASFADNRIKRIEAKAFSCIALVLKILILRYNEIEFVDNEAFAQLSTVQVLLLDNNRLNSIPSKQALRHLTELRHLNLANNNIVSLQSDSFGNESRNLISLNLKGNPLHSISSDSLLQLVKLKTLTLSQFSLSGHLKPLEGLNELRFFHLDRSENLTRIPSNLCQTSRKLSSLVIKSNQIDRIPRFTQCQNLLLLDLSYNRITGSLSDGDFLNQPNLIDLYLGYNQIQSIDERAFNGLKKLQVLELNNNNLKQIHSNAFIPIQSSIYELNLSNNNRLTSIPSIGLEQLISFKSYGNEQLRQLPNFKSAKSLALTYAYHCCDYLSTNNGEVPHLELEQSDIEEETSDSSIKTIAKQPPTALITQLINPILVRLGNLFTENNKNSSINDGNEFSPITSKGKAKWRQDPPGESLTHSDNFTELVIWPQVGLDLNFKNYEPRRKKRHHNDHHRRHRFNHLTRDTSPLELDPTGSERVSFKGETNYAHLIDDSLDLFLEEVKKIRIAHDVRMPLASQFNHEIGRKLNDNFQKEGEVDVLSGNILTIDRRKRRYLLTEATSSFEQSLISMEQFYGEKTNSASNSVKCLPKPSAFFPCQDLFDTWWLRVGIWSVFLLAFTGNILVIIVLSLVRPSSATSGLTSVMWLTHSRRHIDVPRFLVINLAVADLLMAIYLGLLAFIDLSTLGQFKSFAIKWQYSTGCKLAGFLGVLSSELSVFILAIITLERNYAITNAVHLNRRLSLQKAMVIMFIGYTFALSMAIMPLNGISDYKKFSICLPLDIDSNLSSQVYIISLIGINTFSFLLLLSCYLRMYCAIRGSQAWNTNDLRIAKRMSILVITDFLCWMPIIIVAITTLFGYHIIGTNGIKILTIFILPLNSVANPFLYAITTKKFKRDLTTLIRRTRSSVNRIHNCYNGDHRLEDPKIFIGNYNEYQHNLLLNQKKKQNKKNLLANEFIKHQRQQQQLQEINREKKYQKQDKFNYQMSTRPFGHNTANQVTINKTSCSCQRHFQDEQNQIQQNSHHRHHRQASTSGSSSFVVRVTTHMKPKIVLDSVEADSIQVNDSIGTLRNSSSNNKLSTKLESERPYLTLNQDSINNNKYLNSSTFEEQNHPSDGLHNESSYLRPKSDEICDRRQPVNYPTNSSCNAIIGCRFEAHSTNGNNTNEFGRSKQDRYLNVLDNIQQLQQDQARPASACGYSSNSRKDIMMDNHHGYIKTKVASTTGCGVEHHRLNCNNHEIKVCGSYDTIQVKKGKETICSIASSKRSNEKLSQSINRLLFNPIAKAWSSIQISLSSSASHVAALAIGKQSSSRLDDQEEQSASGTTATTPKKELTNNTTTIEEMLLLSSPSNRPIGSERRMSRSCDLVSSQQNQIYFASPSSSMAGGSSQYDYDDDQRILLATISRIAANRESAKRRTVKNQYNSQDDEYNYIDNEEILYHHHQQHDQCPNDVVVANNLTYSDRKCDIDNRRAVKQRKHSRSSKQRFNRCRSWSPALLIKLEDCIHQIKHKIPGFYSNNDSTKEEHEEDNLHYQVVKESTQDSSHMFPECCSNDVDDPLNERNSGDQCYGIDQHNFNRQGDKSDPDEAEEDYDNDISEIDRATNSGDIYDERAIDEWTQRRKNVFRKRHPGRHSKIQHQSSTNSDTLSTRTGVTMVTNMSLSFDDAANLPNNNQLNSAIHRLHSVDEASENQMTVEQDNNESNSEPY